MPIINTPTIVTVINQQASTRVLVPGATTIISVGTQGPPGPPGTGTTLTANTGASLAAFTVVVMVAGVLIAADPTNASHAPLFAGITLTSAAMGAPVNYIPLGQVDGISGLSQVRYYVGLNGSISTSVTAPGAVWQKSLGYGKSSSSLILMPGPSILL